MGELERRVMPEEHKKAGGGGWEERGKSINASTGKGRGEKFEGK